MILRTKYSERIEELFENFPIVAIIGARQIGKTTLAREFAREHGRKNEPAVFYDLEDPEDRARLREPKLALSVHKGLVVIDEIQNHADLFTILRVLVDRRPNPARFLILGSASPALLRQSAESLAGRIAYMELDGFDLEETASDRSERLWVRGGFPPSFMATSDSNSFEWRKQYLRTFTERDLPNLGIALAPDTMSRFLHMLAHYHGQIWNSLEFARSFGVSDKTIVRYLDILCATFMANRLRPWFENMKKRQVKAPKIYFRDSGIFHSLLGVESKHDLLSQPKLGASFEGFAMQQIMRRLGVTWNDCYFWALYTGGELDLLVVRGRRRLGFEFKHTDAPGITPSMRTAMEDLRLARIDVIHAGEHTFPLSGSIRAVALSRVFKDIEPLGG